MLERVFSDMDNLFSEAIHNLVVPETKVIATEVEIQPDIILAQKVWHNLSTQQTGKQHLALLTGHIAHLEQMPHSLEKNITTLLQNYVLGNILLAEASSSIDRRDRNTYLLQFEFYLDGDRVRVISNADSEGITESIYISRIIEFTPTIIYEGGFSITSNRIVVTCGKKYEYVLGADGIVSDMREEQAKDVLARGLGRLLLENLDIMRIIASYEQGAYLKASMYAGTDTLFAQAQYGPFFRDTKSKLTIETMLKNLAELNHKVMNIFGEVEIIRPELVTVPEATE